MQGSDPKCLFALRRLKYISRINFNTKLHFSLNGKLSNPKNIMITDICTCLKTAPHCFASKQKCVCNQIIETKEKTQTKLTIRLLFYSSQHFRCRRASCNSSNVSSVFSTRQGIWTLQNMKSHTCSSHNT